MVNFTYRGLIAPAFTPFNNDSKLSLNINIVPQYAQFLHSSGIGGVLVNGTSGEGMSMNVAERKQTTEAWSEAVKNTKQHLMVQIGGAPLPDVLELARHAESLHVDSLLCLPELYFKPQTTVELIDYLETVSKAAPNTPLLYYHIPMFTNVNIHMGQFLNQVAGKIPSFVGIKFTSSCLDEGVEAVKANNGKFAVFLGADTLMLGAYALGFDSAIATTLNIFPKYGVEILQNARNEKMKEAHRGQDKLSAAVGCIAKHGSWVQTMKEAMNLFTPIKVGLPRPPLKHVAQSSIQEMDLGVKNLNMF